jgi:hypothetical protein
MIATAEPGQIITCRVRNASDSWIGPGLPAGEGMSLIHPVPGPVRVTTFQACRCTIAFENC